MTFTRLPLGTTAIALTFAAGTASADLTAADVWGDWRAYLQGLGYAVTAVEEATGGTLSVSDITMQIDGGPDIDAMTLRMGGMQFIEGADGTVEIVMPPAMPISAEIRPAGIGAPTQIGMTFTQSGQRIIASGDPAAMRYDYTADAFGLALDALEADGTTFTADTARFSLTGTDFTSVTQVTVADTRSYAQDMGAGTLSYDLFFKDPDAIEAASVSGTLQSVNFAGTSALPTDDAPQTRDIGALMAAGFAVDGAITTQGGETRIEMTSDAGVTKIKTGSAATQFDIDMSPEGLLYTGNADQVQIGAQLAGLPIPLFAEMAKSGFTLRTPLVRTDTAQDFVAAFNLTDFTMSDVIWALFDPEGQLPRDPATIALDLGGKAKLLTDIFDPEALERVAAAGGNPAELEQLTINRLTVDAMGATIEATGDLTLDNADKTTLPGFPKPVGDINIDIAGANGLLDKLVALGFLPPQQVAFGRIMLGQFTVPGAAPDTLKSTITFNEEGQILANGQRLR